MKIEIKKFGERLISRPEGRDAALVLRHQFLNLSTDKLVELDFNQVKVLTPSWLDEILQEIYKSHLKENVSFINTNNASVRASLETVLGLS
jgi:hypothetical protein